VLKELRYDPVTHECVVASAWGKQTDWFRNIQVRSALAMQTANEWYVPEQRAVSADEACAVQGLGAASPLVRTLDARTDRSSSECA
jgi:hypothetical protein